MTTKNKKFLYSLLALVIGMILLAYASVPLYKIFCQVTGYGGTPQFSDQHAQKIIDRKITVRFNADTNPYLPWRFTPLQKDIDLHIGQTGVAYYTAENISDSDVIGMATYNVTPLKAGPYFTKVECFCFTDQYIKPHTKTILPVTFYIDPDLAEDRHLKDIDTITLSYTFFPSKNQNIDPQQRGLHRVQWEKGNIRKDVK